MIAQCPPPHQKKKKQGSKLQLSRQDATIQRLFMRELRLKRLIKLALWAHHYITSSLIYQRSRQQPNFDVATSRSKSIRWVGLWTHRYRHSTAIDSRLFTGSDLGVLPPRRRRHEGQLSSQLLRLAPNRQDPRRIYCSF